MRDSDIRKLLSSRDDAGMQELLQHCRPLMRYISVPILQNDQDVEECLAEASARIWEHMDTYDAEKGSFTAWVTAITRNTALNMLRRRKRHPVGELEENTESTEPTPEEILIHEERQRALKQALDRLSQKERNLFYRKYYYRQSTEKIAAEVGMTPRSVEGRLYRIRGKLRKWIGGDGSEV